MEAPSASPAGGDAGKRVRVSPAVAAEAAVWVARLHGPSRSRQMELECLAWQRRSAEHREAFERCTDTWESVPQVTVANAFNASQSGSADRASGWRGRRGVGPMVGVALAVLVLAVGLDGWERWKERGLHVTGVGEQQQVVLDDSSRLTLNTATRVRVALGDHQRRVEVLQGEALFEVAKDTGRPFIVKAAGSEVVALGTAFSVRYVEPGGTAPAALTVTLIEGKVSVQSSGGAASGALVPAQPVVMKPGERLRLTRAAGSGGAAVLPEVDWPRIEQVMAWRRSEAVFDDTSLPDAVAEMNRYSRLPLALQDVPALKALRVSGQFRAGDNPGFARAVASLHGLVVQERAGRLELVMPHQ